MTRLATLAVSAGLTLLLPACGGLGPGTRVVAPGEAAAAPGEPCHAALSTRQVLRLDRPRALAVDTACNLFVADLLENRVLRVTPAGAVNVLAGGGRMRALDGALAAQVRIGTPESLAVDAQGNVYIGTDEARVLRVSPDGLLRTMAGSGQCAPDGPPAGPALQAAICRPAALALDATGNLLIADAGNRYLTRLSPEGTIATLAGNGERPSAGDGGPATAAAIGDPGGIAVGAGGVVFWSDGYSGSVRAVTADGTVRTVAGGGAPAPGESAAEPSPQGLALDAAGSLYVADDVNSRVRRVTTDGQLVTVAGTGLPGLRGDHGPATAAALNLPSAIAFDRSGSLYIADTGNDRVRRVSPTGIISTVS